MALPPGPRSPGVYNLARWMASPAEDFERTFREHGDLYSCKIPIYGEEVVVSHPDLIKQIFTGDPDVFHGGEPNKSMAPIVGDRAVILLDGREHHRQRKLLMPPFHGERLAVYAEVIRDLAHACADELPVGEKVSLLPRMQRLTFDVILQTVFGVREGEDLAELRRRLLLVLDKALSPLGMLWMMPAFQRDLGPLTGWAALKRAVAAADESIFAIIARAREAMKAAPGEKRTDVLSLLLAAVDEEGQPMSDQELRDELVTMLLAGHETTATALSWAIDEICRRPEVLGRILDEIRAAPAGASLPYLDATIKEVLRLRPLTPMVGRMTTAPITLRGHEIPARTYLVICAYNAQRHPDFWEDPAELRPERFLDQKPDPYAWLPFGGGARRCIGMAFALFEMRVVLATLLPRLTVRVSEKPPKVTLRAFLFAPEGGTKVVIEQRVPRTS